MPRRVKNKRKKTTTKVGYSSKMYNDRRQNGYDDDKATAVVPPKNFKSDVPFAPDPGISKKTTNSKPNIVDNSNIVKKWLKVLNWLNIAHMFFGIGAIIFIISIFTADGGSMLAAYSWMAAGVFVTLFVVCLIASKIPGSGSTFLDTLKSIGPLILPGLFILIPLIILIIIFYKTGPIIAKDSSHLPPVFNTINIMAFVSILIQASILVKFYENEIHALRTKEPNSKKWMYISGLILTSIITTAISGELYVIISSFLTDG
tara:strand:+ start:832 stop:1611 length:780 start_codon:yes stop_codon:yes gene_type:complete